MEALQDALNCSDALDQLASSVQAERKKSASYISEIEGQEIRRRDQYRANAENKVLHVTTSIASLRELADRTNVPIDSVVGKEPKHVLSSKVFTDVGPTNFTSALNAAHEHGKKYTKSSDSQTKTLAWWAGGLTMVFTWIVGGSFMGGVFVGAAALALLFIGTRRKTSSFRAGI